MAVTLFLFRVYSAEVELTLIEFVPYLLSSAIGAALVFIYLYFFPSQRKDKFITFFIPGVILMVAMITTGLANFWIVDELILMLSFIFGGQQLSNSVEKSL
jgi:hypothetical protein